MEPRDLLLSFNHASEGNLLENSNGLWLEGFAYNIGKCSAPVNELRTVLIGIELTWTKVTNG